MNKTQLYTLSGALLASTALSSVAGAATVGRYTALETELTTGPLEIANTLFSTDEDDADDVVLGTGNQKAHFGAEFDNQYLGSQNSGSTEFSVEFIPTGARFVQSSLALSSADFIALGTGLVTFLSTVSASTACNNVTNLATRFTIQNCTAGGPTAGGVGALVGVFLTGVTFDSASGLAAVDATVSLSVAVLDPNSATTPFEAAESATIITSVAPIEVDIDAGTSAEADPTTTPAAFSSLSSSNETGDLSITLATISIDETGALAADLTSVLSQESAVGTVAITVESSILSDDATVLLALEGLDNTTIATVANFAGGSFDFTFQLTSATSGTSFRIKAAFDGETAIDAADAGEVTVSLGEDSATSQAFGEVTGETAAISQGGFNSQVNSFNSTTNGASGYGSLLRIHNNGNVAGAATITVYAGANDNGAELGSYNTDTIEPNSTLQLFASDIEEGAGIAEEDRTGVYTIVVTGPIIGYLQHLYYDGVNGLVADVTAFRNGGDADSAP